MQFYKTIAIVLLSSLFASSISYAKSTKQTTKKVEEAPESKQCREGNYEVCKEMYDNFIEKKANLKLEHCPVAIQSKSEIAKSLVNHYMSFVWIDCVADYGLNTCKESKGFTCSSAALMAIKAGIQRAPLAERLRNDIVSYSIDKLNESCESNNGVSCYLLGSLRDTHFIDLTAPQDAGIFWKRRDFYKNYDSIKEYTYIRPGYPNNQTYNQLALINNFFRDINFEKDYFKAFELYKKACELNNSTSCINLGSMLENGDGTKRDLKAAYFYYEKACNLENGYGCKMQGLALEHGVGTSKDIAKATELYSKACDLKDQEGCDLYNKQTDYKPL